MDLAIWPPVLSVALMVGVFLPLLEAGMQMTREGKTSQSAAIVIFSSALVNPVFGWSLTVLLDNFRSEEHTSELQSLMRRSYAVFCLQKKKTNQRCVIVST